MGKKEYIIVYLAKGKGGGAKEENEYLGERQGFSEELKILSSGREKGLMRSSAVRETAAY